MSEVPIHFEKVFKDLTGHCPMPWQIALYQRFMASDCPPSCNLPTGLGKTSVMTIWLIALAHGGKLPRRLVYVVNRRTVVDQATREAEKLRNNLTKAGLVDSLKRLCACDHEVPLAISTLRGQFADNGEWCSDPARPAIIVGTVDMIGSRLLFSGYGRGFKSRPLHAGFLGQDVLLVHDEAHLEPAFQTLLTKIEHEQREGRTPDFRPFCVLELTATSREGNGQHGLILTATDYKHDIVQKRLNASKSIVIYSVDNEKKALADRMATLALKHKDSGRAVLVFAWQVKDVEKIVARLKKEKSKSVQQLTGTLRGLERDGLVRDPIFVRFLPPSTRPGGVAPEDGTVYLVCTSAGEVGVDISADHLVCDLSTFDSMAQRFGRVNRFGDRNDTRIDIVHPVSFDNKGKIEEIDERRQKTLALLKKLRGDGSPKALSELKPVARHAAFAPTPTVLPATDILFDTWAMTTIREKLPGRPPVEPYLHGESDWQPPETHVAWREEVGIITGDLLDRYSPEDLLEDYPLKPHELLRDRSDRIFEHLADLSEKHADSPVWLLTELGSVEVLTLRDLADKNRKDRLNHRTVLLPPTIGGLVTGLLAGKEPYSAQAAYDVANEWKEENGNPRRVRVWDNQPVPEGMRWIRTIDTQPDADEADDEANEETSSARRFWYWYELPRGADNDGSMSAKKPVLWQVHTDDVKTTVEQLVGKLTLPDELKRAVVLAGKWHDLGKRRTVWQRSIRNLDYPGKVLAKSGNKKRPLDLNGYRHEFGSLLDVESEAEFQQLSDDMKDVVRHLIAAHHGRGRPHFPQDETFDPESKGKDVNTIAVELPRRFARLQRKYGRWGMAYLESLLRAADYAASASPSAFVKENGEDQP